MVAHTRTFASRALVAVLLVALAGCSSSSHRTAPRSATTATIPQVPTFRLSGTEVPATGAAALPDDVLNGVLTTLNRYLDGALVAPLRSGRTAADLDALFTPAAAVRLAGPDRATLVDEGQPGPAGRVGVDDASARLTGLLDESGTVSLVAATVDVVIRAGPRSATTRVARSGELVLVPDRGAWRIDGYDLRVTREPVPAAK